MTCRALRFRDKRFGRTSDIMYMVMPTFRTARARRLPALIACLALYVVGSNYCLLGAWTGNTDMACLVLPKAGVSPVAATCRHCAPRQGDSHTRKDTARASCCPAPVVTPSAFSLDRDVATATPTSELFVAVNAEPSFQPLSAWHGHRALPDGQPPPRLARAPVPARAPPLA